MIKVILIVMLMNAETGRSLKRAAPGRLPDDRGLQYRRGSAIVDKGRLGRASVLPQAVRYADRAIDGRAVVSTRSAALCYVLFVAAMQLAGVSGAWIFTVLAILFTLIRHLFLAPPTSLRIELDDADKAEIKVITDQLFNDALCFALWAIGLFLSDRYQTVALIFICAAIVFQATIMFRLLQSKFAKRFWK